LKTRKINYYELKIVGTDEEAFSVYERALAELETRNSSVSDNRFRPMSGGGNMIIRRTGGTPSTSYFISTAIKDEFPGIYNLTNDEIEQLAAEGDITKGIPEEAHFVVFKHEPLNHPIIAIESTQKAPRAGDIESYFTRLVITEEEDSIEFFFDPVFAFDLDTLEERMMDVASVRIVAHHSQIDAISDFDQNTASALRAVYNNIGGEYIEINSWTDFGKKKTRPSTETIVQRALRWIGLIREDPERKEHLRKVDVRATDRDNGGKLSLFDLIQSKVASEVKAEKRRPRSQYYSSLSLHNEIKQKIEEDFRIR